MALVYPLSTYFFHSKAHRLALKIAGVEDGMRILEVATGSGEMFRRLVKANRGGSTVGFDLSPNMAFRTQHRIRREFPGAETLCQAVDARYMPYKDGAFDAVFCCYLLELLGADDIMRALGEIRRVLRAGGRMALVCIGDNTHLFNKAYKFAGGLLPAFWGRQVARHAPELVTAAEFDILDDRVVKQGYYPSRVMVAQRV
jgi:ubiquinone/menaquinone biosynthesis C-methylase UbiE